MDSSAKYIYYYQLHNTHFYEHERSDKGTLPSRGIS